jgi:hypothetical protein
MSGASGILSRPGVAMCTTASEVVEAYVVIDDLLRSEAEADASERACACLREYVQDGDLEDSLYDLVGQTGEPPEVGDLLVFDAEVLMGLGVSPSSARRLERVLNDHVTILAGDVPENQWRTWRESDVEATMSVADELAERVCAAADRLNEGVDVGPVERQRKKIFIRYGVAVIGGLAVMALSGTPAAAAGVFVLTETARYLMELSEE